MIKRTQPKKEPKTQREEDKYSFLILVSIKKLKFFPKINKTNASLLKMDPQGNLEKFKNMDENKMTEKEKKEYMITLINYIGRQRQR